MSLSAPISVLKSKARRLKRAEGVPMCEALDRVARQEGYSSWSLLAAKATPKRKADLWERLDAGDLVLLGARRGHGKTICALRIALAAMRRGHKSWFFSLENDLPDMTRLFQTVGARPSDIADKFGFDNTDGICAQYVIEKVRDSIGRRSVIVIDYLQLLDQRRSSPELHRQVESLHAFARRTGCILVFIAQVDRSFDGEGGRLPQAEDLRLPNPVDLRLFDKSVFLHAGRSRFSELVA